MNRGGPVWITRARPGALATAERVRDLGFEVLVDPLLVVETLDAELDLSHVTALAFTSANGVEAFARLSDARGLPVFAVGRATAKAAHVEGFASVSSADGDVEDLCDLIAAGAAGPVLWAGAKEPAGDLVGMLRGCGVMAKAWRSTRPSTARRRRRDIGAAGCADDGVAPLATRGPCSRGDSNQATRASPAVSLPFRSRRRTVARGRRTRVCDLRAASGRIRAAGTAQSLSTALRSIAAWGTNGPHERRSRSR
jgi:hypothetical protein